MDSVIVPLFCRASPIGVASSFWDRFLNTVQLRRRLIQNPVNSGRVESLSCDTDGACFLMLTARVAWTAGKVCHVCDGCESYCLIQSKPIARASPFLSFGLVGAAWMLFEALIAKYRGDFVVFKMFDLNKREVAVLMAENGRLKKLNATMKTFESIMRAHHGELFVEVTTAEVRYFRSSFVGSF